MPDYQHGALAGGSGNYRGVERTSTPSPRSSPALQPNSVMYVQQPHQQQQGYASASTSAAAASTIGNNSRSASSPIGTHTSPEAFGPDYLERLTAFAQTAGAILAGGGASDATRASRCDRSLYFCIEGSMSQFSRNPALATWKLTNMEAVKYRAGGTAVGSERIGDPSKCILYEARLMWAQNTFPCPVALACSQIRGNCYTDVPGQRCLTVLPVGKSRYQGGLVVSVSSAKVNSKIMSRYGGLTEEDLNVGKLMQLPGKNGSVQQLVGMPASGYVWQVLCDNQNNESEPYRVTDFYNSAFDLALVPQHLYEASVSSLRSKAQAHLCFKRMDSFSLSIFRPGVQNWLDEKGICQLVELDRVTFATSLKVSGMVCGELRLTYRLEGH